MVWGWIMEFISLVRLDFVTILLMHAAHSVLWNKFHIQRLAIEKPLFIFSDMKKWYFCQCLLFFLSEI